MRKKLATRIAKDVPLKGQEKLHGKELDETHGLGKQGDGGADAEELDRNEAQRWREEMAILRRAAEELASRRNAAKAGVPLRVTGDPFDRVAAGLEDPSAEARYAAVRALYSLDPDRAASFFNIGLREGSSEQRRKIGAALAGSGLVDEAIDDLSGDSHENSYGAFSFLFLVAKAGEVQPLLQVIENHPSIDLRLTVIKLLASSGEPDVVPAFRRLAASSLPPEVRAAVAEAIGQLAG